MDSIPSPPEVVATEEWQAALEALRAREKEQMRGGDALAAERRRLPMVEIEKDYAFEGPDGKASLLDLFEGRPAADRLPLHVRPQPGGGLRRLLDVRRQPRPSGAPAGARHLVRPRLPRAVVEAGGVQATDGLGRPLVLVVRERLQRRLRRRARPSPSPTATRTGRPSASASSSATATASSAPTSPTAAGSSRSPATGRCSTSPRSAARRSGRTRPRAGRSRRPTVGGDCTTSTTIAKGASHDQRDPAHHRHRLHHRGDQGLRRRRGVLRQRPRPARSPSAGATCRPASSRPAT